MCVLQHIAVPADLPSALVPRSLFGVRDTVLKSSGLLNRDEVSFRLSEVLCRRVPAVAVDRLEGPVALRPVEGRAGSE